MGYRNEERQAVCTVCGARLRPGQDREYGAGTPARLCFDCAGSRGEVWDESLHRWVRPATRDALDRERVWPPWGM